MNANVRTVLSLAGISLFVGVIIVSIGLGAAIPDIERVAAPLVCGGGSLQLESQSYSYRPGDVTTTRTWYCLEAGGGAPQDITWSVVFAAGLVYSAVIFVVLLIWWLRGCRIPSGLRLG